MADEKVKQKWYMGKPVTVVGETHPSPELIIRYENGETESVSKHLVTELSPADLAKIDQDKADEVDKLAKDKLAKDVKMGKIPPTEDKTEASPIKEWFKK